MTVWHPTDDGFADLASHDSFAHGAPHNTFARMRCDDPMAWCDGGADKGFWSVTRFDDILELNKQHTLLSSAHGIRIEDQTEDEVAARRTFQETDPPQHSHSRALMAKAFSKKTVSQFEDTIRSLTTMILDRAFEEREFNAVQQIARELPMRILGQIIGVPEEDMSWLVDKGDALMANSDPDFTDTPVDLVDTEAYRYMPFRSPAGADLYDYAAKLMAKKNAAGDTDGVLHMLLQPNAMGDVMSDTEFRNFFCLMIAAGNDTTRYSIAAGLQSLCQQPELLGRLKTEDLWDTAPDEIVRWASPATYFRRTALSDFEFHGKQVRAGDKVLYWWVSGNRDETAFDDPFRVDLARTPNRHVGFGQGGPHTCLGMWLARLELKVMFQEIARRVERIEQTGPCAFVRSNFVGGIKNLPVRITGK